MADSERARSNARALRDAKESRAQLRRRVSLVFMVLAGCVLAASVACTTDYQKGLEDPNFGLPNALAGQKQPGPSSAVAEPASTSGTATVAGCVKAGQAQLDGGACTVSFKTDVLGAFATATCDRAGCHGGQTPPSEPRIAPAEPEVMWNLFANFKLTNGKFYVNPCSTEPTQSTIAANVNAAAPPAERGVLMPLGGTGLATDVVQKIEAWVKCGSPNN